VKQPRPAGLDCQAVLCNPFSLTTLPSVGAMMLRGLVLAAALMSALADIPVHCVHRDILGTWELMMGESDGDSSATCGHVTPDRIMTMVKHNVGPTNPRFTVKRTLTVEFKNPNVVVGPEGRQGVWTTVYDEGFDIELDGWNVSWQ